MTNRFADDMGPTSISPAELGMLISEERAVLAAVTQLRAAGFIAYGRALRWASPDEMASFDPFSVAIYRIYRTSSAHQLSKLVQSARGPLRTLRDRLVDRGLMGGRLRVSRRTALGRSALESAYREFPYLNPAHSPSMNAYGARGAGFSAALYGGAALWAVDPLFAKKSAAARASESFVTSEGSPTGDMKIARKLKKVHNDDNDDASGCGSAAGSSCGGGGGGCGGGGS